MRALVEFLRLNLVVAQPDQAVVLLQIVQPLVVHRLVLVVVRVHQLVDAEPRSVEVAQLVLEVARVVAVVRAAVNAEVHARKLVVSAVASLTNSCHKPRRVIHRVRHRHQRASL